MGKNIPKNYRLPADLVEELAKLRGQDDTDRDVVVRVLRAGLEALKKKKSAH